MTPCPGDLQPIMFFDDKVYIKNNNRSWKLSDRGYSSVWSDNNKGRNLLKDSLHAVKVCEDISKQKLFPISYEMNNFKEAG